MPDLALSVGVRRRTRGSLRPSTLYNMFLEKDDEAPDGFARQSRQGLVEDSTAGEGPVDLFTQRGVFNDSLFALSGGEFHRDGTSIGPIPGTGATSFTAGRVEVLVTRGAAPYSYLGGSDLANAGVLDDDDIPYDVRAVAYLGGYFIAVQDGTNRFYWSSSQDGRTWDGLDFASAESSPDNLLDAYVVNDSLWLMGEETVEVWQLTGDGDAPFARVEGILLKKGIKETGLAAELDNSLFWWGHDNMIYRAAQGVPLRVSDNTIEEQLEGSTVKGVFAFVYEGHGFLCVRTDSGTFVLDVSHQAPVWSEWGTYERDRWAPQSCATPGGDLVFGDDSSGTIWRFDEDNWDDGGHMERRLSASFTLPGGTVIGHKVCLIGNPGTTPLLTGQGSEPLVEMRASRDNGQTWGDWRSTALGAQGRYRQRIEIRRWGLFDSQGGIFEFRVTDPVPFRCSRAYANEPGGGRSTR